MLNFSLIGCLEHKIHILTLFRVRGEFFCLFRFIFVGLKLASMSNFTLLGCLELVKKFVVRLKIWTWTKLNKNGKNLK